MKLQGYSLLALVGGAAAAPHIKADVILNERAGPCSAGAILVYETGSRHLCVGFATAVTGVIGAGGWFALSVIKAFKSKGCDTQQAITLPEIPKVPVPGDKRSLIPREDCPTRPTKPEMQALLGSARYQCLLTAEDGAEWEMADTGGKVYLRAFHPDPHRSKVRRGVESYLTYEWSASGRNDCSTTMSDDDLADLINNHAMPYIKIHNTGCAQFFIDNSGTFHGTLKVAACDNTGCHNQCWGNVEDGGLR